MPLQSKPPLPSALVRPGRRPPGSTVVKRATVKFASDVAQSDVADFASDVRQTGSGPAAPASDRLGELLRLYSELSFERKNALSTTFRSFTCSRRAAVEMNRP